jgi:hypothetical protein
MIVLQTEDFQLGKFRTFVKALDALSEQSKAKITVDDTDGNLTITLVSGNDLTCFAIKSKTQ